MPFWKSVLRDALLVLATSLGLFFLLVYLPAGLGAAEVQDQAMPWMESLGASLPLPYRIFRHLQALTPWVCLALLVVAVVHALLRRAIRGQADFGDSFAWDALLSPFVALPAVVLAAFAVFLLAHEGAEDAAGLSLVAGVCAAILLQFVGLLLAALARERFVRRAAVATGVLLVLAPLCVVVADFWGERRLAGREAAWQKEVEAERQRLAARPQPVLRGAPIDENAAPRYRKLMASVSAALQVKGPDQGSLGKATTSGPDVPLDPKVQSLLEDRRADLIALREATRCTRCDWETRYDEYGPVPSLLPARTVCNLLVVEGHQRVRAGDLRGAAERYLDAVRFGSDFGEGSLLNALIGIALARTGLDALGRLLVTHPAASLPLADIRKELAVLDPHLPNVAPGFRAQRLSLGRLRLALADHPEAIGVATPRILPFLVPYSALTARAVDAADPVYREMERVATIEDPKEARRIGEALAARDAPTLNFVTRTLVPSQFRARTSSDDLRALFRLVQAAAALEQSSHGRYPADGRALDLPVDPHGYPARLRYAPTADGEGYKLWSVGLNQADDGGNAERGLDLVLERKPRP